LRVYHPAAALVNEFSLRRMAKNPIRRRIFFVPSRNLRAEIRDLRLTGRKSVAMMLIIKKFTAPCN
jgi:hypothetical protein